MTEMAALSAPSDSEKDTGLTGGSARGARSTCPRLEGLAGGAAAVIGGAVGRAPFSRGISMPVSSLSARLCILTALLAHTIAARAMITATTATDAIATSTAVLSDTLCSVGVAVGTDVGLAVGRPVVGTELGAALGAVVGGTSATTGALIEVIVKLSAPASPWLAMVV